MHYKKRKLHKLHSIPIGLCNKENHKRLYLVSYSIPLSCMVVLLLGFGMMINPEHFASQKSYAVNVATTSDSVSDTPPSGEGEVVDGKNGGENSEGGSEGGSADESFGGYADELDSATMSNSDDGIMPLIDVAHPEISMAVSNETGDGYGNIPTGQVITAPGAGTAYRSHKITVTGQDIEAYQLTISAPQTNLIPSSGASTEITGAGGATGESMAGNTWGYAWGDNTDEVTGMKYYTVTSTGSNLECTQPNTTDFTVNCEKKLVFGANFAAGADGGTYTANVTVSLTSTPHLVGQAWSNGTDTGIDDMQDIDKVDGGFCNANIPAGSTITLRDPRGGVENFYKIMKMSDGSCWMMENLRLKGGVKITKEDSQVNSDYILPTNSSVDKDTMNWGTNNDEDYMAEGSPNMKIYDNGGSWKEAYGNYYSWCAATAMSCKQNRTGAALSTTDAAESICPKGWKLPVGTTGKGSFQSLYDKYPNSQTAGWMTNQPIAYNGSTSVGYNGLELGAKSLDAFFPAAGRVGSDGLNYASTGGLYWSRRADFATSRAYYLNFTSSLVNPQNYSNRYYGFSVRCVAAQ